MSHYHRPSLPEDCLHIAPQMRLQDVTEILYSHGASPLEALQTSYSVSQVCNSIIHEDGDVVGMFGLAYNGVFGSPWLLGTDKLPATKKVMLPIAKAWVEEMLKEYPILLNYVHIENKVSLRWLKSLGFSFVSLEEKYGTGQQPFYKFARIGKCVIQQ